MSEAPTAEKWFTSAEACEYLGISLRYLYYLIQAGQVGFSRLTKPSGEPGEYRFKAADLDAYMATHHQPAGTTPA